MSQPSPSSPEPLGNPVDEDAATVLVKLKEIASHDGVAGVAVWCLQCLQHPDAEIRVWSAEALDESVQPASSEASGLIDWTQARIAPYGSATAGTVWQSAVSKKRASDDPLLADQLYWTVKILGRLDSEDPDTRQDVRGVINQITLLEVADDDSALLAVVERARRAAAKLA
ncbi:hypothetical protein SAMN06265222_10627 [Neorhodopirellula lusitana]|uniref:HEAT repeat domain-containing protein n=1 Tax=Neorhodopirellula lusitana TaxID=445327 RepID=A0ABY1Q3L3_9BACT|nr:hypothetical protein [Neorhodopirellula lusitana]SMP58256.1 hypothetical protein SAMN06265222_10627 [Neorhodopirellula lusitana]